VPTVRGEHIHAITRRLHTWQAGFENLRDRANVPLTVPLVEEGKTFTGQFVVFLDESIADPVPAIKDPVSARIDRADFSLDN
jgi:hypothetical protein